MVDFSPQNIQGSSLRGESFIRQPVEAVDARSLNNLADAAQGVYQNVQFNRFNKKAGEVQEQFLDDFQTGTEIKNLQDELDSTPEEDATYQRISGQIQTLQDSLKGRRIDPTEAMGRIEDLKRQALNHAPSYASRIRNLGGASSSEFDTVTEQLITEENNFRNHIQSMGLDPDIQSHRDIARKDLNDTAELRIEQNNQALTPFRKAKYISGAINNRIATIDAVINKQIDDAGGNVLNMSNEDRQGMVIWLQGFTNGNEAFTVKQMIDANPNIEYEDLPSETVSKMEAQVKGAAEAKIAQLNGSVPKTLSENELAVQSNESWLKIQRDDPILFDHMQYLSKFPAGSIAEKDISNIVGDRMRDFMLDKKSNHYQDTTLQSMREDGVDNPEIIHQQYSKNLKDARNFIEQNPEQVDGTFVQHHTDRLIGDMQAVLDFPRGFLPEQMDEIINHISSEQFDRIISQQNQSTYNEFKEKSGQFLEAYATENMAPDINRELDKEISTDSFGGFISGIVGKRGTLRDLLSVTINPNNGTLQFIPNTGLKSVSDERKAAREARRLTQMYSSRSRSIVDAALRVSGASQATSQIISNNLFRNVLESIGEPIRESAEEVQPGPTSAEQAADVIMKDLEDRQNRPRMPGPFGF